MFKALVSRGSKALQRLDERLNDEGEEDAFEEGWGEEERKRIAWWETRAEAREEFERSYFIHHLEKAAGNMTELANKSGMERTHLYRKLKSLGIDPKSIKDKQDYLPT